MHRRLSNTVDAALASFGRVFENFAKRLLPAAPASRPAGGPVVFRHYL